MSTGSFGSGESVPGAKICTNGLRVTEQKTYDPEVATTNS